MLKLNSIHRTTLIALLFLAFVSCRKKIDYQNNMVYEFGAIDSSSPILTKWESVYTGANFLTISKISSNDDYLVFLAKTTSGVWQFNKLDSMGNVSTLFNASGSSEPTVLTYQAPFFYSSYPSSAIGSVIGFDDTGVQYSLDFDLGTSGYLSKIIHDGNNLYLFGVYGVSSSNLPNERDICVVDYSTGLAQSPMTAGLYPYSKYIRDAVVINGTPYICGYQLFLNHYAAAKWTGTTWEGFGNWTAGSNTWASLYSMAYLGQEDFLVSGVLDYNGLHPFGLTSFGSNSTVVNNLVLKANTQAIDYFVRVKSCPDGIFSFGNIRMYTNSFLSVNIFENNDWRSIGAINKVANDVSTLNGYVYAVCGNTILKHKIAP